MAGHRIVTAAVISISSFSLVANFSPAFGQDAASEVENSKYQITGTVNANAAYVRSGPSENDYPTAKLDKGATVTVVGERFNWLKIMPPDGSFCYVAKAYVNRAGNGSFGMVTSTLNVRVGSELNAVKSKVASKLEPDQRVEIIGEQDEYFKIKPPADVYFYISKQYVDPVKPLTASSDATPAPADVATAQPATPTDATAAPAANGNDATASATPSTQPDDQIATATPAPAATQPSADASAKFDLLETRYGEIAQKPLDEQPVEKLLADYQKLDAAEGLPESLRRICDFRISVLKNRSDAKQQFVQVKQQQDSAKQKTMALQSEQHELEDRVKTADVQFYTAVGMLRTSSLQQGPQTLYRLTDPANGRTVVYLRSNDAKIGEFIGQFIGVKGDVSNDAQLNLRIVTTTDFGPVNPAQVGTHIAAQIVPPTLMPSGTASNQ